MNMTTETKKRRLMLLLAQCTQDDRRLLKKWKRKYKLETSTNKAEATFNHVTEISAMFENKEITQEQAKILLNLWSRMYMAMKQQGVVVNNQNNQVVVESNMVDAKKLLQQVIEERRLKQQAAERNQKLIEQHRERNNIVSLADNQPVEQEVVVENNKSVLSDNELAIVSL